ncbi:Integrin beta-6 [Dissostichus eleginoides]|uniref:Integrin beta-6 n=1 Tax=Dissostichus eleginoides TaxID=100907 RepID=A0AAD9B8P5_DISEL|nr:Integrin beta-6 [Dissostichus eleginoides]
MSLLPKCPHLSSSSASIETFPVKTTAEGYTFPFSCPAEDVHVYQNKSKIAVSVDGPRPYDYSDEVKSMTSDSVTTRHCRDLQIQCFFTGENKFLTEICVDYKVTKEPEEPEKQDEPDPTFSPKNLIVALFVVVGLIVIIVVLFCWKKKQYCARKASQFSTYLRSCLRITKREGAQTPCRNGFQENIAGDLEGQQLNGDISMDREADGRSAPVSSLDHNLSCEGVQPTKK